MKFFRQSYFKNNTCMLFLSILLAGLLSACGGSSKEEVISVSANTNTLSFSNEVLNQSDDSFEVSVNFQGQGLLVGFAPDKAVPWLEFELKNVTANTATLRVSAINEERAPPSTYKGTIRLTTTNSKNTEFANYDIDVSLLVWQLSFNRNLISFGDTFGVSSIPTQTLELFSTSNNQWTISSDAPWLSFDKSSGTGTTTFTLTANPTTFTEPGLYQGNIIITETTSGDTKLLPIELGLDNLYLYASEPQIAFVQTANTSHLTQQVSILSNTVSPFTWQATSDVDWLTLTPSADGKFLTITADSTKVTNDALNTATVTLSSTDIVAVKPQPININLYSTSQNSELLRIQGISLNNNSELINAPNQPWVYLATANKLQTYHLYTGALVKELVVAPEDKQLENLIIHPLGQLMLAQVNETTTDANGRETTTVIHRYKINLTDDSITELDNTKVTILRSPRNFINIKGRYFVVSQLFEIANENLERLYIDGNDVFFVNSVSTAEDTGVLYALNANTNFRRYSTQTNDFTTINKVSTTFLSEYRPELLPENTPIFDFTVTNSEKSTFLRSQTSEWLSFADDTFTDNGLLPTTAIRATALPFAYNNSKQPHYVRFDGAIRNFVTDIYNTDASLVQQTTLGSARQPVVLKISQDQQRAVFYTRGENTDDDTPEDDSLEISNLY